MHPCHGCALGLSCTQSTTRASPWRPANVETVIPLPRELWLGMCCSAKRDAPGCPATPLCRIFHSACGQQARHFR
jgi:hypothetical protein